VDHLFGHDRDVLTAGPTTVLFLDYAVREPSGKALDRPPIRAAHASNLRRFVHWLPEMYP
jgi:hypothetical protein